MVKRKFGRHCGEEVIANELFHHRVADGQCLDEGASHIIAMDGATLRLGLCEGIIDNGQGAAHAAARADRPRIVSALCASATRSASAGTSPSRSINVGSAPVLRIT